MSTNTNIYNNISNSALDDIFNSFELQNKNKNDVLNEKIMNKLINVNTK
jgi:hypothetical protein